MNLCPLGHQEFHWSLFEFFAKIRGDIRELMLITDTGDKLFSGVNDTGEKFIAGVVDTGCFVPVELFHIERGFYSITEI